LSAANFGENFKEEYLKNEVKSHPVKPLEAAKEFICPQFLEPADVLNAANYMIANQLASEPAVRKAAREKMYERATVTIRPTKKGFKEIDENHYLYM
jgi:transcription elongation factor SPT6